MYFTQSRDAAGYRGSQPLSNVGDVMNGIQIANLEWVAFVAADSFY